MPLFGGHNKRGSGRQGKFSMLGILIGVLIGFHRRLLRSRIHSRRRRAATSERAREQKIQLFYQRHPECMGRLNKQL